MTNDPSLFVARQPVGNRHGSNEAVTAVIRLVDELLALIEEENRHLASGAPASTSSVIARKAALAEEFGKWVAGVRERQIVISEADSRLHARLRERSVLLRQRMHENVDGLRAAVAATRRRVDAIMRAIREQVTPPSNQYGASGRLTRPGGETRPSGSGRWI